MERESFEDEEVAAILNSNFVSIKVDREERPDIDHIYMTYCQAMTGAGGWPLTVILTPEKQPFFSGTYFPKHSHFGRPGLIDILTQVSRLWPKEKEKVLENAAEISKLVAKNSKDKNNPSTYSLGGYVLPSETEDVSNWGPDIIRICEAQLEQSFDPGYGGFGLAPKFPSPHNLGFLMRYSVQEPQSQALFMVEKTLDCMADGGIYDQIGSGFARYSTDRLWLAPHFEKMLYDNAGLALIYLEAYQLSGKQHYARIAWEVFNYVLREMTSPEGGFYSAEDADSEGEEGQFYLWRKAEIEKILADQKTAEIYCLAYGITEEGNFEGINIPNRIFSIPEEIADSHGLTLAELEQILGRCKEILYREREKRVHPAKDDKILTSWNGLMIAAMAKGFQVFSAGNLPAAESEKLLSAAEKAAGFIMAKMNNSAGRLLARYRKGEAGLFGYLDDYAFLIFGLLELYTALGKPEYLIQAIKLQQEQERLFRDSKEGGYYFTGNDAEELLIRPKETYDGAIPSGNSISTYNLLRLWKITGESNWLELAEQQFITFRQSLQDNPVGHTAFLQALQFYLVQGEEIVLAGKLNTKDLLDLKSIIFKDFRPFTVLAYNEGTIGNSIPRINDYPISEKPNAFLCRNFACLQPVDDPEKLKQLLLS